MNEVPDVVPQNLDSGALRPSALITEPIFFPQTGLFHGEAEAIETVLRCGAQFGYGNMIAHLRKAWAENLRDKYGFPDDAAIRATESSPYPLSPRKG